MLIASKSFGQYLDILSKKRYFSRKFHSEFCYIEVWFIDQNCEMLEVEDETGITLFIL